MSYKFSNLFQYFSKQRVSNLLWVPTTVKITKADLRGPWVFREVSFFTGRGAPENWGVQVLFLRSKRGDQKIFSNEKGDHLYFLKETKYFVEHFRFQRKRLSDATREGKLQWDLLSQCRTFSYILVLMLISHNLRRNAEGIRITLVYKVQFLCGPPSFRDGYKNTADTTDIL